VIESSTATAALEQLQVHSPDILISDIAMPDMDGYEPVRAVRNLPPQKGKHTPAIALSGCNQTEDLALAANAGFKKHLSKPFELQVLITTVMGFVNKPSAQI
jgi:CheY-like chemotaxis protein